MANWLALPFEQYNATATSVEPAGGPEGGGTRVVVRGAGLDWEVQEQVVDYSTTDELVVRVRRPSAGSGAGDLTRIVTGTRVALGVVLPIARPSFALYQPATDEGEAV